MTTTLTINLPDDAIVSDYIDLQSNLNYLKLTISKTDIPCLAKFLLNGMRRKEKEQLSLEQKEGLAKAAGLKYVYRLPSIMRTLMLGAACGIAIKTFAAQNISLPTKETNLLIKQTVIALKMTLDGVNTYPYTAALALAGTSLATNFVSNESSYFVSSALEGTLSIAKGTVNAVRSGMNKVRTISQGYLQFCLTNPKTGIVLTASLPLGSVVWFKSAEINNLCKIAYAIGANLTASLPLGRVVWFKSDEIKNLCKIAYAAGANIISTK